VALPPKAKPGDPIRAADWNALIDFVRAAQIVPGSGVRVTRTPSGTALAVAPGRVSGARPAEETHPFQGYQEFRGSGDPPEDQPFRFRVRHGLANNMFPSNMDAEFVAAAGSSGQPARTVCWLETSHDASGDVLSCHLDSGGAIPREQQGGAVPPPKSYHGLFAAVADDNGITAFQQLVRSSLWVVPQVVAVGCDHNEYRYRWGAPDDAYWFESYIGDWP
jgi:hypothetical protein